MGTQGPNGEPAYRGLRHCFMPPRKSGATHATPAGELSELLLKCDVCGLWCDAVEMDRERCPGAPFELTRRCDGRPNGSTEEFRLGFVEGKELGVHIGREENNARLGGIHEAVLEIVASLGEEPTIARRGAQLMEYIGPMFSRLEEVHHRLAAHEKQTMADRDKILAEIGNRDWPPWSDPARRLSLSAYSVRELLREVFNRWCSR